MSFPICGFQGTCTPLSRCSWRWRDSNPWPPACKAGALPTELHPHRVFFIYFSSFFWWLGLSGLEPPTSRLSGVRSNRLSYKPGCYIWFCFLGMNAGFIDASHLFHHGIRRTNLKTHSVLQASLTPVWLFKFPLLIASVEMVRFELMTPCLQGRCSPNWATPPLAFASI